MKRIIFSLCTIFLYTKCTQPNSAPEHTSENKIESESIVSDKIISKNIDPRTSVNTIKGEVITPDASKIEIKTHKDSLGWTVDIFVNGKKSIIQPMIPAVPGHQAFISEMEARKVGELMAFKMKNNIMPPAVSIGELDSLKIHYKK